MRSPPVILQILPRLNVGGAELDSLSISEAITKAGAHSLIATEGGGLVEKFRSTGAEIIGFPAATKNPARILQNASALIRLMRNKQVNLLHAHSRAPAWSSLLACRKTGVPFVTTCHGSLRSSGRLRNAYNSVMIRGDRVIAVSKFTANEICCAQGCSEFARLRTIHCGINLSHFDPSSLSSQRLERLRQLWGVNDSQPIIFHPARLTRLKGHSHLIEAVARLRSRGVLGNFMVIMAGDAPAHGAYREELANMIGAAKLELHVKLVGNCDDMPAGFALAHSTVITSTRPETFARVSAESQIMRCPVVAPDLGANRETIIAGDEKCNTGWLFPVADVEALSDRLASVLAITPEQRAIIGARARAHAVARFGEEKMQRATLSVYDELLGTGLAEAFDENREQSSDF